MRDYLIRFTEDSARSQKIVRKSLSEGPSKPTKGVLEGRLELEKTANDEPSKPTEAAFVGFEGEGIELFTDFETPLEPLHSIRENQSDQPYLTERNELVIPTFTPKRFRWWQGGQSIWATLAELGAPLETWRRHAVNQGEFLFSPQHADWCNGEVRTGHGFAYCVECGGNTESHSAEGGN